MISRSIKVICIAGALSMGIATTHSAPASSCDALCELVSQTNSGLTADQQTPVGPAIMELRRLSGMTWEQLASLFEVTRRTVHFWASGKALNSYNEEKLYRILSAVRQIDRGAAQENRDLLFTAPQGEMAPIDLLRTGQYADVVRLLGAGSGLERPTLAPLSESARRMRMPSSPETLVGALQGRIDTGTGRVRPVRAVRVKKQKQFDDA
ncbi:MAG: XRE family transcriptional regulator [Betaproteobacteria bacterium]|nr:XRE family transcriptional regulator [Betaproteobacteria bacterium]